MTDIDLDAITERAEAATPSLVLDAKTLANWRHVGEVDVRRIAESAADVPVLVSEVRRLTADRDNLARWKDEALPVMAAFLDLARRVVPDSAVGRFLPDVLAEHVDRQAAALREVGALFREAQSLVSRYTRAPGANGDRVADLLSEDAYRIGADGLAILARHSGGRAE